MTAANTIGGQYVIFCLGEEHYGLAVSAVREIVVRPEITPVPEAPADMVGIVNLRGDVLPVVDLRTKLGVARPGDGSRLIVMEVDDAVIGGVVDRVEAVQTIEPDTVQPSATVAGLHREYMLGLAKQADRLVLLFDPAGLFAADAATLTREAARSRPEAAGPA